MICCNHTAHDVCSLFSQYKKSKNKGVMMAARSLISLYRDMNPELLHRKERGRTAAMDLADGKATKILGYGEQVRAASSVAHTP